MWMKNNMKTYFLFGVLGDEFGVALGCLGMFVLILGMKDRRQLSRICHDDSKPENHKVAKMNVEIVGCC